MTSRILLAVDDSPAALAAAKVALALARDCGASVRAVTVVADHAIAEWLRAGLGETDPTDGLARRRDEAATAVLRYVEALARRASVPLETVRLDGEPAAQVLDQSRTWPADLIVLGRSDRPGPGEPYVGAETRRVLEFADRPVLVVPGGDRRVEGS
jgi:nucleotide-binding universal stress UspA family protein